jgi:hypothetical protein
MAKKKRILPALEIASDSLSKSLRRALEICEFQGRS